MRSDAASAAADKIVASAKEPVDFEWARILIGASVGIAPGADDSDGWQWLRMKVAARAG